MMTGQNGRCSHAANRCKPGFDSRTLDQIAAGARRLCSRPGFSRSDLPDLEQQIASDVWRRIGRFDPGRAGWATFVARIITSAASSIARARRAGKRDFRRNGCSLNDSVRDGDGEATELSDLLDESLLEAHLGTRRRTDLESSELRQDVASVIDTLSPELRLLCVLLPEISITQIARALGKSRRDVKREIALLRARFTDAGLRDFL